MTEALLYLARTLHLGSGLILLGTVVFRWLVWLPAARGLDELAWKRAAPFCLCLRRLLIAAFVIQVVSGLLLFWAVAAGMSGANLAASLAPDILSTVFRQTQFGWISQGRLALAVALAFVLWRLIAGGWPCRRQGSMLEIVLGFLALALLVSFAGTGHAAATAGSMEAWRIAIDALHLFAAAIWPAGLLPFALFLHFAKNSGADFGDPERTVVRRFSETSFVTVAVLIGSGILNAIFLVGSFSALVNSPYGRLLCLKLGLLVVILALAARNRYRLLPALFLRTGDATQLLRRLHGFVWAECGLAAAIVLVVAVLGATAPPR